MAGFLQELDKLRIFVIVARRGKINEAAAILHLTQPSVSRSIQKLENSLGLLLFIRSRDGVKLTKGGQLLFRHAEKALRELEDAKVRALNLDQEFSGNLTIGSYESLAEYLWPDFLLNLENLYPKLNLSIKTNLAPSPLTCLQTGTIDLLVDAEPQIRSDLVSRQLYSDKFAFYASYATKDTNLTDKDVSHRNVIFVQQAFDENSHSIEDHLEQHGFQFSRQYCFDSFSTVKRLAIRGMGIAVLPKRLAAEDCKQKLIRPISFRGFDPDGFGRHSIFATVRHEDDNNPRIKKIIKLLKNHFKY
jgi:DNA-binding transcriptional LysR family regulator